MNSKTLCLVDTMIKIPTMHKLDLLKLWQQFRNPSGFHLQVCALSFFHLFPKPEITNQSFVLEWNTNMRTDLELSLKCPQPTPSLAFLTVFSPFLLVFSLFLLSFIPNCLFSCSSRFLSLSSPSSSVGYFSQLSRRITVYLRLKPRQYYRFTSVPWKRKFTQRFRSSKWVSRQTQRLKGESIYEELIKKNKIVILIVFFSKKK